MEQKLGMGILQIMQTGFGNREVRGLGVLLVGVEFPVELLAQSLLLPCRML